jgi:hypothetical protein
MGAPTGVHDGMSVVYLVDQDDSNDWKITPVARPGANCYM